MCNVAGCTFCAMISVFGTLFMFLMGVLIKANYKYVGEWYLPEEPKKDEPHIMTPTPDQISKASAACFAVGGIYIGFTVMAIVCIKYQQSRAKRA